MFLKEKLCNIQFVANKIRWILAFSRFDEHIYTNTQKKEKQIDNAKTPSMNILWH